MAKAVFFSFHYDRDVHRVQLVRNINALEGQPLLGSQDWETVRRGGDAGIEKWIDEQMAYKKAVVVLIGKETAGRPWVQYEVKKAWAAKKPMLGIRIHGLSSMGDVDSVGANPFTSAGIFGVPIYDPTVTTWHGNVDSRATYNTLVDKIEHWSGQGIIRS